jgi:hypothetical protein
VIAVNVLWLLSRPVGTGRKVDISRVFAPRSLFYSTRIEAGAWHMLEIVFEDKIFSFKYGLKAMLPERLGE